jgi:hypothetical protein
MSIQDKTEAYYKMRKVIAVKAYELTIEEAWLYMPKSLKALIRFLGMLLTSVVIVLCAI